MRSELVVRIVNTRTFRPKLLRFRALQIRFQVVRQWRSSQRLERTGSQIVTVQAAKSIEDDDRSVNHRDCAAKFRHRVEVAEPLSIDYDGEKAGRHIPTKTYSAMVLRVLV